MGVAKAPSPCYTELISKGEGEGKKSPAGQVAQRDYEGASALLILLSRLPAEHVLVGVPAVLRQHVVGDGVKRLSQCLVVHEFIVPCSRQKHNLKRIFFRGWFFGRVPLHWST